MTISDGTQNHNLTLEHRLRNTQLDAATADFYKQTLALHQLCCNRIRQQASGSNVQQPKTGQTALQHTDMLAYADDIQKHARAVLELLQTENAGQSDELTILNNALTSGSLAPETLVAQIYRQDAHELSVQAEGLGLSIDILLFFAFACARPVYEAITGILEPIAQPTASRPGCPVCGSAPYMARLMRDDGHRRLTCRLCATEWTFNRMCCAFCGTTDHALLEVFMVDSTPYRIDACTQCMHYIKTVDERAITDESYIYAAGIDDIATLHIDIAAERQGFSKPVFMPVRCSEDTLRH